VNIDEERGGINKFLEETCHGIDIGQVQFKTCTSLMRQYKK
jgi:hypothetical protein